MADHPQTSARGRFGVSREQWLAAALDLLEERGVEAVRVQALAARMGVNKSGFYWHFGDRAALLDALLDYWAGLEEQPLKDLPTDTPEATLRHMAEIVDRENLSRFDAAIRQWAKTDEAIAEVYKVKMERRLDIVRTLFARIGFSGPEVEMRARTYVAFVSTAREIFGDLDPEARAEIRGIQLHLLTAR